MCKLHVKVHLLLLMLVLLTACDLSAMVSPIIGETTSSRKTTKTSGDSSRTTRQTTTTSASRSNAPISSASTFVRRAREGGTVRLAAGTFRLNEPLILRNSVSIIGEGQEETVLEISAERNGSALDFMTRGGSGTLTLRDLTVRYTGNDFASVIRIHNSTAWLDRIEVMGGKRDVTNDRYGSGVEIRQSATAMLEESTFRNNEHAGVLFDERSVGEVRNSFMNDNGSSGLISESWNQVILEGNVLRNNRQRGILFAGRGIGEARNNVCESNGFGIVVRNSSQVTLEANTLRNNAWGSIIFSENSTGEVRNNVSEGNGADNKIVVRDNSQVNADGDDLRDTRQVATATTPSSSRSNSSTYDENDALRDVVIAGALLYQLGRDAFGNSGSTSSNSSTASARGGFEVLSSDRFVYDGMIRRRNEVEYGQFFVNPIDTCSGQYFSATMRPRYGNVVTTNEEGEVGAVYNDDQFPVEITVTIERCAGGPTGERDTIVVRFDEPGVWNIMP